MELKPKYILMAFACLFLMSGIYLAQADIAITSPTSGTYDNEVIPVYVQVLGGGNHSTPVIKFTNNPGQSYPMSSWGQDFFIYNVDFSEFENGTLGICVESYADNVLESDNVTISISHPSESSTPDTTPDLKLMKVTGITNSQKVTDYETRMIYLTENGTGLPIEGASIYIMEDASTLTNAFTTSVSGRAKIEWVDYDDEQLPDDIYFFKIEKQGYEVIEYDIRIAIKPPEEDKPEMILWGLDRKYNTDMPTSDIIKVKDSDTDKFISDVVIRVITGSGIPVTSNMITNEYGTVDFNIAGIQAGAYSVVFEHPDYETKIQDITISFVPTPTPTPPPTPIPTFTAYGTVFKSPYNFGGVSYSSAEQYINDWNADGTKKIITTPTPAPTVQVTNSSNTPTIQEPKLEIGWLLTGFGILGLIGMVVFKNHSKSHPESATIKGLRETAKDVIAAIKKPETTIEHIPVQDCEPDLDIEASVTGSTSDEIDHTEDHQDQEEPPQDTPEGPEESEPPTVQDQVSAVMSEVVNEETPEPKPITKKVGRPPKSKTGDESNGK